MNIEWGQLQLEQSTWATHGRIEKLARTRLQMLTPAADAIVIVRPQTGAGEAQP
jgi:cell division protein FtsL